MNILAATLNSKSLQAQQDKENYKPEFFRISEEQEKVALGKLLEAKPYIKVSDTIQSQLKELAKTSHPSQKLTQEEIESLMLQYLAGKDIIEYGVWVYYPWSEKLVHILDEEEFIMLRTNRNKYKITDEESALLAGKKIGVIGLSVGQSVSLTLAMERSFGELRIADYDDLEITNLNRLRSGIHNMGLLKTVLVAREIAEIDPFLKVTCFHNGITEENIDAFLTENGKLDILIDECDSVDIKILCRVEAKKRGIPVVMEASDRATIDVERFDLEPTRPIVHGWLDHLKIDFSVLKTLKTSEEKLPYMLPISGLETLSPRMKASMMELEQSISTWPQLASAVTLGGGITADLCRRILLNQFHESGRYFIDLEELIGDRHSAAEATVFPDFHQGIQEDEMDRYIADLKSETPGFVPDNKTVESLVEAAVLAPTGGNSQPWKWRFANGRLFLFKNEEYKTKLVDFDGTGSVIGFGAATENLFLKANELGLEPQLTLYPLGTDHPLVATFSFKETWTKGDVETSLSTQIPFRQTNRRITTSNPIKYEDLDYLVKSVSTDKVELKFITETDKIKRVANIMAKADRIRIMHEGGHVDFLAEIVWPEDVQGPITRGLDIDTLHLSGSERIGFKIARDWNVINHLNKWNKGSGLERVTRKTAEAASAIGLITIPDRKKESFFNGGRMLERVWLGATERKISFQPISISTFLFNRYLFEGDKVLGEKFAGELADLKKQLDEAFCLDDGRVSMFLFRLFYDENPWKRSLHLPANEVLSFK
jgi:molybdopterin/thiamine biosynthesis adenylyltransferase